MKGIILALVLTLLGSVKSARQVKFPVGKEFSYDYVGEARTGLQNDQMPQAGLRFVFTVKISAAANERYRLTLSNGKQEDLLGNTFVHSPRQTQEIQRCLFSTIFELNGRGIGKLFFPKHSPRFCRNIVRGIANMIPMTYKDENMYEAREIGIQGDCETKYTVQEDRKNNKGIITKTKNLMNCKNEIAQNIGMAYLHFLPSCPVKDKWLAGTQISVYKVKYEDDSLLITEVEANEIYQVTPGDQRESAGTLTAKQVLTLTGVKSVNHQQQQQQQQQQQEQQEEAQEPHVQDTVQESIYYTFPDQPLMPIHYIETDNIERQLMETVREIVRSDPAGNKVDMGKRFWQAIELARRGNLNDLTTVFQTVANEPARLPLLHAIAMSGTLSAMEFLKTALHNDHLSYSEKLWIIAESFHFAEPNERVASMAAEIINSPRIKNDHWLSMTNVLAYGALAFRCLSESPSNVNEILKPIHGPLSQAIQRGDEQQITLYVKAASNAANVNSMKLLTKIMLAHNKYSDAVIVNTIWAIREVTRMDPKKGQEILIEPYMDRSYPTLARIAAGISLLNMNASFSLVTTMVKVAASDDNEQFRRFMFSYMSEIAGLGVPQYADLSSACKIAIRLMKRQPFKPNLRYSTANIFKLTDRQHRFGVINKILTMSTRENPFPSTVMLGSQLLVPGAIANMFEARVHSEFLKEILKGQSPFEQGPFDQKIRETEKGVPGEYPKSQDAFVSLRMLDKEVAYFDHPERNLKDLLTQEHWPLIKKSLKALLKGVSLQSVHPVAHTEIRRRFPSMVGVAWETSAIGTVTARVSGTARLEISLGLESDLQLRQLVEAKVKLSVDLKADVHVQGALTVGIVTNEWQRTMQTEVEGLLHLPLKAAFTLNWKDQSFKIELSPICKKTELVKAKHSTSLVVRNSVQPRVEKKLPLLPVEPRGGLWDECFESSESDSREDNFRQKSAPEKKLKTSAVLIKESCDKVIYKPFPGVDLTLQSTNRERYFALLTELMKRITAEHEFVMAVLPGATCAEAQMVELEVLLGAKVPKQIIKLVRLEDINNAEDDDESVPDEEVTFRTKNIFQDEKNSVKKQKVPSGMRPTAASSLSSDASSSSSSSSSPSASPDKKKNKSRGDSSSSSSSEDKSDSSSDSSPSSRDKGAGQHPSPRKDKDSSSSSSSDSSKIKPEGHHASKHSSRGRDKACKKSKGSSSESCSDSSSSDSSSSRSSSDSSDSSDSSRSSSDSSSSSSSSSRKGSSSSSSSRKGSSSSSSRKGSSSSSSSSSDSSRKGSSSSSSSSSDSSRKGSSSSSSSSSDSSSSRRSRRSSGSSDSSDSSDSSRRHSSSDSSSSSSSGSSEKGQESSKWQKPRGILSYRFRSLPQKQHGMAGGYQEPSSNSSSSSESASQHTSSSSASSSSGASSSPESPFLGEHKNPVALVVYRVIYSNKKPQGVLLMLYTDLESSRPMVQVVMSNISEPTKPIAFMEAVLLNPHKAVAFVKFGRNCQQYKISAEVETGLLAGHPAIQFKADYARAPSSMKKIVYRMFYMFDEVACKFGLSQKERRNNPDKLKMILAEVSPGFYSMIISTPRKDTTIPEFSLPLSLPGDRLEQDTEQHTYPLSVFLDVRSLLLKNQTGVCSVYHNNLTTFSGAEIQSLQIPNCPLILVEDKKKVFSVMMVQESSNDLTKTLIFKTRTAKIVCKCVDGKCEIRIDGVLMDLSTLPSRLSSDNSISITKEKEQLVLNAADHIICYYDGDNITIEANPTTMPGRVHGLCGHFDGEINQEFRTPSGYMAKNALSFAQSWVHTEGPCEGACKLQHSFVKLENTIEHLGQQSDCYTAEQVLQCRKDCSVTESVSVPVALHCLPAGSTTNLLDTQTRLDQKSEDLEYLVDAHTSCSCENQQCAA